MKRLFLFSLVGLFLFGFIYMGFSLQQTNKQHVAEELNRAFIAYQQGEKGQSVAERKQGFNTALEIYSQLEEKYKLCYSNGKFFYNFANTYFQLGEYPLALLYYYRALALMPRNSDVKKNLDITLEKLKLPKIEPPTAIQNTFIFHYFLSLPERLQILCGLGIILLFLLSLIIWFPSSKFLFKIMLLIFGGGYFIFFVSVLYSRYIEPMEGVLMKSTSLYRDKGKHYAKVSQTPSAAGLKVQVLDIQDEGNWLKILTPEGILGYVPNTSIRIISCE